MADNLLHAIRNVAVIGGGRWARVYIREIATAFPHARIGVLSARNSSGIREWAEQLNLAERLDVTNDWSTLADQRPVAAFVATAAEDHTQAVNRLVSMNIPTLVEKPMALFAQDARQLVSEARARGVRLATGHVLMFAPAIRQFAELVRASDGPSEISFIWSDERGELRGGEAKRYDASLPIFRDILPHIFSILTLIEPLRSFSIEDIGVERGGTTLKIAGAANAARCRIAMIRDGQKRTRIVEAITSAGAIRLDVAEEPGVIISSGMPVALAAGHQPRPLIAMISQFLRDTTTGTKDIRFDPDIGVLSCDVADRIVSRYRAAQAEWLGAAISSGSELNDDVRYALRELLFAGLDRHAGVTEAEIAQAWKALKGPEKPRLLDALLAGQPLRHALRAK